MTQNPIPAVIQVVVMYLHYKVTEDVHVVHVCSSYKQADSGMASNFQGDCFQYDLENSVVRSGHMQPGGFWLFETGLAGYCRRVG